jgi:hypothetical protein
MHWLEVHYGHALARGALGEAYRVPEGALNEMQKDAL